MIQKVNDLNWWIEYQDIKLYWYQKIRLLFDKEFMEQTHRIRIFVEKIFDKSDI